MPKFPLEFPVCPICQSRDRVGDLAFKSEIEGGNKAIPITPFRALEQEVRLLQNPATAVLTIPALILSWDICAGCGIKRCVKAEKQNLPVQAHSAIANMSQNSPFKAN